MTKTTIKDAREIIESKLHRPLSGEKEKVLSQLVASETSLDEKINSFVKILRHFDSCIEKNTKQIKDMTSVIDSMGKAEENLPFEKFEHIQSMEFYELPRVQVFDTELMKLYLSLKNYLKIK